MTAVRRARDRVRGLHPGLVDGVLGSRRLEREHEPARAAEAPRATGGRGPVSASRRRVEVRVELDAGARPEGGFAVRPRPPLEVDAWTSR